MPEPGLHRLAKRLSWKIDWDHHEVVTTWAGGFRSRAVYLTGYGCLLVRGGEPPTLPAKRAAAVSAHLEELPRSSKLEVALDHAFIESPDPPLRQTKAIVILHDGKVAAERSMRQGTTPLRRFWDIQ